MTRTAVGTRARGIVALLLGMAAVSATAAEPARRSATGPWDVEALKRAPSVEWAEPSGKARGLYYAGEPLDGKPTRVFAYYARPEGDGPFPAMVLVHGGGGKAFPQWAALWADRGYAVLAMDLSGNGPDGRRLPDGGPDQGDDTKFRPFADAEADQMWTYHAVAAVLRGHSLLASLPEVDKDRIGVTGISWGGYLTCIVAGIDDRVKAAVPVYGCGFLDEDSAWLPSRFSKMEPEQRERWVRLFDPSRYLPGVSCPIFFVNGTNDFAYPLGSYQKSYRLVPDPEDRLTLRVTVRMPHGHGAGWEPKEIGLFADSLLTGGAPLVRPGEVRFDEGCHRAFCSIPRGAKIAKAQFHYTADTGPWQKREWMSRDAEVSEGRVAADLTEARPLTLFFTVTDERGAVTSGPHIEIAR
jgi:dienelactone hydrolase